MREEDGYNINIWKSIYFLCININQLEHMIKTHIHEKWQIQCKLNRNKDKRNILMFKKIKNKTAVFIEEKIISKQRKIIFTDGKTE